MIRKLEDFTRKTVISLIFFLTLLLSSCDSYGVSKSISAEENTNTEYTIKDHKIIDNKKNINLLGGLPEIHNQKEAIDILGEPSKKIISVLLWNLSHDNLYNGDSYNEYVDMWFWEKPIGRIIIFDIEEKVHDRIQLTMLDFIEGKSLKEVKLKNSFNCRNNCVVE